MILVLSLWNATYIQEINSKIIIVVFCFQKLSEYVIISACLQVKCNDQPGIAGSVVGSTLGGGTTSEGRMHTEEQDERGININIYVCVCVCYLHTYTSYAEMFPISPFFSMFHIQIGFVLCKHVEKVFTHKLTLTLFSEKVFLLPYFTA